MNKVSPFILCGGAGTRLWPLSREAFPKQFHKIAGPETLLQQTCRRFANELFQKPCVLANVKHRFLVAEQLAEVGLNHTHIVLEPVGKSTAPAACISALLATRKARDSLVLLAPSDHVIADADVFANAVARGVEAATDGALVTFGVEPDCPHTGYGYMETDRANSATVPVLRFIEKPSRQQAEEYLSGSGFYWNAGIFLFQAGAMLGWIETYAPEILLACQRALDQAVEDLDFLRLDADSYVEAPAISLDYAIAEKLQNIRCVPLATSWSDVGSWSSVWELLPKDDNGNVVQGEGKVLLADTSGSYAYSEQGCLALVGLENVVVVATEDAVLVASKAHTESVKTIVDRLKGNGLAHALYHNRVYRPWGWYQTLNRGDRYQVKCIMVKPGGTLSLQSHFHRAEHWVVVKGTLEVTKGEDMELLSENQSTFIPIGKPHRLANPGKIPAFLIEVQSGPYLDEDDIVRLDDVYRRDSGE